MLKGRDLLGYTVNQIGGDKLLALYKIADEILGLGDVTRRAISLINPVNQYMFLEEIILEAKDSDNKLIEYLKSYNYPLPRRWGWRHKIIRDNKEEVVDTIEWYDKENDCYCSMFKTAMQEIENAVDCSIDVHITSENRCITIDALSVKEVFEMYEM